MAVFANELKPTTAVKLIEGKNGYIDKTGTLIISPTFDAARGFSEGLAEIAIDHKWGFVDSTGRIAIKPQFDLMMPFSNGLAYVNGGKDLRVHKQDGRVRLEERVAVSGSRVPLRNKF